MSAATKDLIVLVADGQMGSTITGLLSRPQRLGIREISFDIRVHPWRDAGCRGEGHTFLSSFTAQYSRALVMFDREGCGQETMTRISLESDMEERLSVSGWDDRAACVVFDPELEIWVWSDSPHVARILGWPDREAELRAFLTQKAYFVGQEQKPKRPKEAVEAALKNARLPRSSSRYQELAERVSFRHCTDVGFLKFKATLQSWFP
ncbi:hypothetical protein IAD21_00512 [Abditibacteriota bacterium]|nr:hypothetical protein IAD21_00512 [Abditibacteriota bacterium]